MKRSVVKKPTPEPKSLLEIVDVEQGTDGWFEARCGLVTASNFAMVLRDAEAKTRTQYLHRLAGEVITGKPTEETYKSKAMERGKEMEPQAIADYERRKGVTVKRVGLGINFSGLKRCGASPDALVGFDGGLETKTMRPDLMIPLLLRGSQMLPEHRPQVQGNMLVFERDWWDLKIFWPSMPNFTVRVFRDEKYLSDLHNQIEIFNHDLTRLVERLRQMGSE